LKTADAYSVPWVCVKFHIGQTGRPVETKIKEHHRHVRLYHSDKSAVAEHIIYVSRRIQFQDTKILATKKDALNASSGAVGIELHPD
jgi:hypothetical protein